MIGQTCVKNICLVTKHRQTQPHLMRFVLTERQFYVIICLENIIFLPLSFWLKQSRFCHLDILTSFCALEIEIYCGYVIDVSMISPFPIWKIKGKKNLTLISMVLVNKWETNKKINVVSCSYVLLFLSKDDIAEWDLMTWPNKFQKPFEA